MILCICNKGAS